MAVVWVADRMSCPSLSGSTAKLPCETVSENERTCAAVACEAAKAAPTAVPCPADVCAPRPPGPDGISRVPPTGTLAATAPAGPCHVCSNPSTKAGNVYERGPSAITFPCSRATNAATPGHSPVFRSRATSTRFEMTGTSGSASVATGSMDDTGSPSAARSITLASAPVTLEASPEAAIASIVSVRSENELEGATDPSALASGKLASTPPVGSKYCSSTASPSPLSTGKASSGVSAPIESVSALSSSPPPVACGMPCQAGPASGSSVSALSPNKSCPIAPARVGPVFSDESEACPSVCTIGPGTGLPDCWPSAERAPTAPPGTSEAGGRCVSSNAPNPCPSGRLEDEAPLARPGLS